MYKKELETVTALAYVAAETILTFYSNEIIVEEKLGVDNFSEPVTAADREASRIIVSGLREAFPLDHILSEEEPDDPISRLKSTRVWIIDPIDGTSGFILKDGSFAVQIGLAENGVPVVGAVLMPASNLLLTAARGQGAFIRRADGQTNPLKVSDKTDVTAMTIATSRNHRNKFLTTIIESLGVKSEIQSGSVGLKVGLIAEQICDFYVHPSSRTKLWDTCGPQVILEEAGGKLTDLGGKPLRYDLAELRNLNGILATNGVSHDSIVASLAPFVDLFQKGA